jgi:hypothetical protein
VLFHFRSLIVATLLLQLCCVHAAPARDTARVLFGPVLGHEPIGGRVEDDRGRIILLANGSALVVVDVDARVVSRVPLRLDNAKCWGLARLSDGSVWTLKDRNTLAEIDLEGRLLRQIPLAGPHLGLFSTGNELLYEQTGVPLPAPVLRAGPPGSQGAVPWGGVMMRPFADFTPGIRMALNVVKCGIGRRGELPCWFPDEPAISLIDARGHTRRVELSGLYRVSPETLIASETPARPVRDVFVDDAGVMWVLSSGRPPARPTDQPGGWVIARYRLDGTAIDQRRLTEPVREILRAGAGGAIVLTGAGMISELAS